MKEFVSLPITAAQITEGPIDPDFSVMPDSDTVIPGPDITIDPDFSVTPDNSIRPDYPIYPIIPPFVPSPSPVVPCVFCNNNQWLRAGIRLLNAATGYSAFSVYIDNRLVYSGLSFPQITQYRQISQGYHTFSVTGSNGYTYVRKSMYVGDGMATLAIVNASNGLDLTLIEDVACPTNNNSSCFRVCNLAYFSGPINAALGNVYYNAVDFKKATSFSPYEAGNYTLTVARSARPEIPLVTSPVALNRRRIYTAYVLNWNTSPDTVQTLVVEDRRN